MRKGVRIGIIVGIVVVLIAGLGIVVLSFQPSKAESIIISATLSEILGIVQVQNDPQSKFNPVNDGFILKEVMELQTKEQSKVRLDLSTGSILRLGQLTIFSLDPSSSSTGGIISRIQLQLGKVWIVLRGGSLDVSSPGGLASVRGSYMSVWFNKDTHTIIICCLEGTCTYTNNAGTVNFSSGQKIISSDPNVLPVVQPMDMSDIQDWLDNCPEAAAIIPSIMYLIATSTPSITPEITPTITASPTVTLTPTPTRTPYGWVNSMTATYSYMLTATATYSTGTTTPTGTPTPTPTLPGSYRGTRTPTPTNSGPRPTNPPPPAPTATQPPPPVPTATPNPYP